MGIAMKVKNQQLLWDLYADIVINVKKPTTTMGPICGYCNKCKKPTTTMGPICGYCNKCKKPTTTMGPICGYCNECKKPTTIIGPICEYCNKCKKQCLIWDLYAGITYLKMALWIYNKK